ncbi:MAG TPA: hypothetical protein VK555_13255 [Terriglobales bacterium]|nr:hypothetical protein [Terriglobales bacterium]
MKRKALFCVMAISVLAMCLFAASTPSVTHADDFDNPKAGAVKWKVVDYNRNTTHPARIPFKLAVGNDGGIGFDFLYTPDTALLGTSHPSYRNDLIGDMSGKTVSARVGVSVTSGNPVFTYYGQPSCGDVPANVRLYFETNTSGKFEETDYWWSNPMSYSLESLKSSDQNLVAVFSDPTEWSDYNGHFGSDPAYTAAFAAAVKDVQFVGLSFGGGCFFENGVGIQPGTGSAYFRLMDFTATP